MRVTIDVHLGITMDTPQAGVYFYRDDSNDYFDLLERIRIAQVSQYAEQCAEAYCHPVIGQPYDIDTEKEVELRDKYVILELDENKNVLSETIIYREPTSKLTSSIVDAIKAVMA